MITGAKSWDPRRGWALSVKVEKKMRGKMTEAGRPDEEVDGW